MTPLVIIVAVLVGFIGINNTLHYAAAQTAGLPGSTEPTSISLSSTSSTPTDTPATDAGPLLEPTTPTSVVLETPSLPGQKNSKVTGVDTGPSTSSQLDSRVNWTLAEKWATKPARRYLKPQNKSPVECRCDLTRGVCDFRCCCDKDCRPEDKRQFSCKPNSGPVAAQHGTSSSGRDCKSILSPSASTTAESAEQSASSPITCIESKTVSYLGDFWPDMQPVTDRAKLDRLLDEHDPSEVWDDRQHRHEAILDEGNSRAPSEVTPIVGNRSDTGRGARGAYRIRDQVSLDDFIAKFRESSNGIIAKNETSNSTEKLMTSRTGPDLSCGRLKEVKAEFGFNVTLACILRLDASELSNCTKLKDSLKKTLLEVAIGKALTFDITKPLTTTTTTTTTTSSTSATPTTPVISPTAASSKDEIYLSLDNTNPPVLAANTEKTSPTAEADIARNTVSALEKPPISASPAASMSTEEAVSEGPVSESVTVTAGFLTGEELVVHSVTTSAAALSTFGTTSTTKDSGSEVPSQSSMTSFPATQKSFSGLAAASRSLGTMNSQQHDEAGKNVRLLDAPAKSTETKQQEGRPSEGPGDSTHQLEKTLRFKDVVADTKTQKDTRKRRSTHLTSTKNASVNVTPDQRPRAKDITADGAKIIEGPTAPHVAAPAAPAVDDRASRFKAPAARQGVKDDHHHGGGNGKPAEIKAEQLTTAADEEDPACEILPSGILVHVTAVRIGVDGVEPLYGLARVEAKYRTSKRFPSAHEHEGIPWDLLVQHRYSLLSENQRSGIDGDVQHENDGDDRGISSSDGHGPAGTSATSTTAIREPRRWAETKWFWRDWFTPFKDGFQGGDITFTRGLLLLSLAALPFIFVLPNWIPV